MYDLLIDDAIQLVRRNVDEQSFNDSEMEAVDDNDSTAFEELCKKLLPEAINEIHSLAPIHLLNGIVAQESELSSARITDDVLTFQIDAKVLRLVAFNASDSPVTLSDVVNEQSVEGRMQHNKYTRGTFDNPTLVLSQVSPSDGGDKSVFTYYSLRKSYPEPQTAIKHMEYIPFYSYLPDSTDTSYKVAKRVIVNIINQLTAKVLAVYNQKDKANYFFSIAGFANNDNIKKDENI